MRKGKGTHSILVSSVCDLQILALRPFLLSQCIYLDLNKPLLQRVQFRECQAAFHPNCMHLFPHSEVSGWWAALATCFLLTTSRHYTSFIKCSQDARKAPLSHILVNLHSTAVLHKSLLASVFLGRTRSSSSEETLLIWYL